MICKICAGYYKLSVYNQTDQCYNCIDQVNEDQEEDNRVYEADVKELVNPSGKTQAIYNDE